MGKYPMDFRRRFVFVTAFLTVLCVCFSALYADDGGAGRIVCDTSCKIDAIGLPAAKDASKKDAGDTGFTVVPPVGRSELQIRRKFRNPAELA